MKKIIIKKIILILFINLFSLNISAENDGGLTGAFLNYCNSVRNYSLGRSDLTNYNDPSSAIENPALLAECKKSVYLMYSKPFSDFDDINYQSILYNQKLTNKSGISAGISLFNVKDIEERNSVGNLLGYYDGKNTILTIGYGYELIKFLYAGTSVKYVQEKIYNFDREYFAADISGKYHINEDFDISLILSNLYSTESKFDIKKEKLPIKCSAGLGLKIISGLNFQLSADMKEYQKSIELGAGAEYIVNKYFEIRCGYNSRYEEWTAGFGLNSGVLKLDYGFGNNTDLGNTHRIGLTYIFE